MYRRKWFTDILKAVLLIQKYVKWFTFQASYSKFSMLLFLLTTVVPVFDAPHALSSLISFFTVVFVCAYSKL